MKYPYRLFLMLTSICNLNCVGCGHFCELKQEHGAWFISLEKLDQNLNIVKEKMPHLEHILLIGGEPMVHPQFLEICKMVRDKFPNIGLTIMTNGLNLHTFSNEELKQIINECEISITFSIYPTTIDIIKKQVQRLENLNLKYAYQGSRINFTKFTFNHEGKVANQNRFNQCSLRLKPEFTLADNKLYSCCISPRLDLLDIPEQYNDYLDLNDLNNENQVYDLKFSPPNKCRFCGDKYLDNTEIMPWHSQAQVQNSYFESLRTLYINDYQQYYFLMNDMKDIYKAIQDPLFAEHIEEVFNIDSLSYIYHKLNHNTIDIYIPITNHTNLNFNGNFYTNLTKQTIIKKCNLYFVCINMNKINETIIYDTFTPYKNDTELFSYLYKANNIKEGYDLIKNEGYGKLTYALDLEDIRLQNPTFLEEELKECLND